MSSGKADGSRSNDLTLTRAIMMSSRICCVQRGMRKRSVIGLFCVCCLVAVACQVGCVRRTMTIETEPDGALVILNDQELGRSPVSIDFTWYGDYSLLVRKDGFKTLDTNVSVKEPWYQLIPFDFIAEVLWPQTIVDRRQFQFTLEPAVVPAREELLGRAAAFRDQAIHETQ